MTQETTYLDRNEYNYGPAPEVAEVLKNFDPNKLCFYTRIYDRREKKYFFRLSFLFVSNSGKTNHSGLWRRRYFKTSGSLFFSRERKTKNIVDSQIFVVVL